MSDTYQPSATDDSFDEPILRGADTSEGKRRLNECLVAVAWQMNMPHVWVLEVLSDRPVEGETTEEVRIRKAQRNEVKMEMAKWHARTQGGFPYHTMDDDPDATASANAVSVAVWAAVVSFVALALLYLVPRLLHVGGTP